MEDLMAIEVGPSLQGQGRGYQAGAHSLLIHSLEKHLLGVIPCKVLC